jgi:hypothetical protein
MVHCVGEWRKQKTGKISGYVCMSYLQARERGRRGKENVN